MTTPRFNLDPAKATDWLTRVVDYNENDDGPADNGMPAGITAAWHAPSDDGTTVEALVRAATAAGLIAAEGINATLEYEFLEGGERFDDACRVLVTINPGDQYALTLASSTGSPSWVADDDLTGAGSALSVLIYVTNEGNDLLGRLRLYAANYASAENHRAVRRAELKRLTGPNLRDMYRRGITRPSGGKVASGLNVRELATWTKDEVIAAILAIEFPGC